MSRTHGPRPTGWAPSGYRRRPWLRNDPYEPAEGPSDDDPHAEGSDDGTGGGSDDGSGDGSGGPSDRARTDEAGDGLSDLETGEEDSHSQSISEQDDGYGNTPAGDDVEQTS